MELHYDAFISYNHNPRDIRIAGRLQHDLEHFHIPADVRSSSGKKRIERVFLDTGELEASGDLNEEILKALHSSDYLIVICSPESKASPWVTREIEFFLEEHDRDHILTVLTEGEPADSFPDILLSRIADSRTNGDHIAEPLSADYRGEIKETRRKELPRLVAALIGCRYDDLIQRRKHYRRKMMARIAALMLIVMTGAAAYVVRSTNLIRSGRENTLIQESQTLAFRSREALKNGDRTEAARLALEALPSEDDPRPVVSEAVNALSEALSLYADNAHSGLQAIRIYEGTQDMNPAVGGSISKMDAAVCNRVPYLAALYSNGSVCLWQAGTGSRIMTDYTEKLYESGTAVINLELYDDGTLVLVSVSSVYYVDILSGAELWHRDYSWEYSNYIIAFMAESAEEIPQADGSILLPVKSEGGSGEWIFNEISLEDGSEIMQIPADFRPDKIIVSDDGRYAAFRTSPQETYMGGQQVYTVDLETGTASLIAEVPFVTALSFTAGGKLTTAGYSEAPAPDDYSRFQSLSVTSPEGHAVFSIASERTVLIDCYDPSSGELLWSSSYSGTLFSVPKFKKLEKAGDIFGPVAVMTGSDLRFFNEDGSGRAQYEYGLPPELLYGDSEVFNLLLIDGTIVSEKPDQHQRNLSYNMTHSPISDAVLTEGNIFIIAEDNDDASAVQKVTQYAVAGSDSKWTGYDSALFDIEEPYQQLDLAVLPLADGFAEVADIYNPSGSLYTGMDIAVYDHRGGLINSKLLLEGRDMASHSYETAGSDVSGSKMYFLGSGGYGTDLSVMAVDAKTMQISEFSVSVSEGIGDASIVSDLISVRDGMLYAALATRGDQASSTGYGLALVSIDLSGRTCEFNKLTELTETDYSSISSTFSPTTGCLDTENGVLSICLENTAHIWNFDGTEIFSLDISGLKPTGIIYPGNGDVILTDNSQGNVLLTVYDASSGREKFTSFIEGSKSAYLKTFASTRLSDDELLLTYGTNALIIDDTEYKLRSTIRNYSGYDPKTQFFYTRSSDEAGMVPYRTVDEMIAEGKEWIGE